MSEKSKQRRFKDKFYDASSVRDSFMAFIAPLIVEYVDWYAEEGLTLPDEYATKPGEWTDILRKMQKAMKGIQAGKSPKDDPELQEGLDLIGRHLYDLHDPLAR